MLFRKKLDLPDAAHAVPGRSAPIAHGRKAFRERSARSKGPIPKAASRRSLRWAAIGAPEKRFWSFCSGVVVTSSRQCRRHNSQPRPTKRCAPAAPATPSRCSSSTTPGRSPTKPCSRRFGNRMTTTQGMRQGNDVGTQYRSAIFWTTRSNAIWRSPRGSLRTCASGRRPMVRSPPRSPRPVPSYFAEDYHQQYLAKKSARLLRAWRHWRRLPNFDRRSSLNERLSDWWLRASVRLMPVPGRRGHRPEAAHRA